MSADQTQAFDMPIFPYDGIEPDGALNAVLKRSRGILGVDLVEEFPFRHGRRPKYLLIGRLRSGCHRQASHNYQGNQPENSHFPPLFR
jgi:hypothetical protein